MRPATFPTALVLFCVIAYAAQAADTDADGIEDGPDNCDYWANPLQENADSDAFGDPCDADADADGIVDVAPALRVVRQVGNTPQVRLLWSRGSGAFGDPAPDVTGYQVERSRNGGAFITVASGDHRMMVATDLLPGPGVYEYRVRLETPSLEALSVSSSLVAAFPLFPPQEVLGGVARLVWSDGWTPPVGHTLAGYELERFDGGWFAAHPGMLVDNTFHDDDGFPSAFMDSGVGENRYRVRAVFEDGLGGQSVSAWSNEEAVEIRAECAEIGVAMPTNVILANDLDADLDLDGNDLALALTDCSLAGGCILRALPETYENVSIMITNQPTVCDGQLSDLTTPEHCLDLDFPNGLVIEGHGEQTVFASPLWMPPTRPPAVLEFHRQDFPLRLRNLVLDGRKHEQVAPDPGSPLRCNSWQHNGLRVWNQFQHRDVVGDGIGDDDLACEVEACLEEVGGVHDGDGICEVGEHCIEDLAGAGDNDGVCENESWQTYDACESITEQNDGCLHNVQARGFLNNGATFNDSRRWSIEYGRFEDSGCWNGGDGFDCPYMDTAPDRSTQPGVKCTSFGLSVGGYTREFVIRENVFERANKYALNLKNGSASSCNGLLYDHQVLDNEFRDLGHVGIFAAGLRGTRVEGNHVEGTRVWPEIEPSAYNNTFGIHLAGFCSDDNDLEDNTFSQMAGLAIGVSTIPETDECTGSSCARRSEAGNRISNNVIDQTCLLKNTAAGSVSPYSLGSIHFFQQAQGRVQLVSNTLTGSGCRFALSIFGGNPLNVQVIGGSYESGSNAATPSQNSFYAGAVHVHGLNRHLDLLDSVSFVNMGDPLVPKASAQLDGTIYVDDVVDGIVQDPFGPPGQFADYVEGSGGEVTLPEPGLSGLLGTGVLGLAMLCAHRQARSRRSRFLH
jgi:hypothetical protein